MSSKTAVNGAETTIEKEAGTTTKDKDFVVTTPVFKQFEFILCNKFGEPRVDSEGKIVVISPLTNSLVSRVFLTKPDERRNMKRTRVVKLINKFDDALDKDLLRCKFKIEFKKNIPASKDTHLDDIMSYNNILDYVERENNNVDSDYWRFRKILSHSLISGKKGKEDKIEI